MADAANHWHDKYQEAAEERERLKAALRKFSDAAYGFCQYGNNPVRYDRLYDAMQEADKLLGGEK